MQIIIIVTLIGCGSKEHKWQGYTEGKFTYISANYAGTLKKIFVSKGDFVHKDDSLLILEAQPERDEVTKARANVNAAEANKKASIANLDFSSLNYKRDTQLIQKHAIEQNEFDKSRTNFLNAQATAEEMDANLTASKAILARTIWSFEQKQLVAPKDSLIFDTYYLEGELVLAGQAILSLIAEQDIYVIFYVSEKEVNKFKTGQQVLIHCDGCKKSVPAKISYISQQAEYTPPVIYSDETRSKLIYRIEASPSPNNTIRLHPGQPVTVTAQK